MDMKKQILVVDDELPIRELLAEFFTLRGYEVVVASTAEDAKRLAAEKKPDLAILDVALADSDGLDLLGRLKRAYPTLPIVMLTGLGYDEELLQNALMQGASSYVSKTLPLDHLLREIHRVLHEIPDAPAAS
jgi:DNA-binding response OmpR family regulator